MPFTSHQIGAVGTVGANNSKGNNATKKKNGNGAGSGVKLPSNKGSNASASANGAKKNNSINAVKNAAKNNRGVFAKSKKQNKKAKAKALKNKIQQVKAAVVAKKSPPRNNAKKNNRKNSTVGKHARRTVGNITTPGKVFGTLAGYGLGLLGLWFGPKVVNAATGKGFGGWMPNGANETWSPWVDTAVGLGVGVVSGLWANGRPQNSTSQDVLEGVSQFSATYGLLNGANAALGLGAGGETQDQVQAQVAAAIAAQTAAEGAAAAARSAAANLGVQGDDEDFDDEVDGDDEDDYDMEVGGYDDEDDSCDMDDDEDDEDGEVDGTYEDFFDEDELTASIAETIDDLVQSHQGLVSIVQSLTGTPTADQETVLASVVDHINKLETHINSAASALAAGDFDSADAEVDQAQAAGDMSNGMLGSLVAGMDTADQGQAYALPTVGAPTDFGPMPRTVGSMDLALPNEAVMGVEIPVAGDHIGGGTSVGSCMTAHLDRGLMPWAHMARGLPNRHMGLANDDADAVNMVDMLVAYLIDVLRRNQPANNVGGVVGGTGNSRFNGSWFLQGANQVAGAVNGLFADLAYNGQVVGRVDLSSHENALVTAGAVLRSLGAAA